MTAQELIALLSEYPPDAPVFDGRGYDLKPSSVTEQKYDDWATSVVQDDGDELPGVGVGVSIGPRF